MSGTVELAPDGAHLVIRFPYRPDLVTLVKTLPGRRFDGAGKFWTVPATHAEEVYKTLAVHLFDVAPEVMQIVAGTRSVAAAPVRAARTTAKPAALPGTAASGAEPTNAGDALTISQLNLAVREALQSRFPQALWVVGEVLDYDKGAGRQHRYFKLIERQAETTAATVDAVLWGRDAARLLPRLEQGEQPFRLRDGLEIRAKVRVDYYPANGRLQMVVEDIDPSFTLGKLALSRENILAELRKRGLEQRNRMLGFPVPSLRIGVLTSLESDGWNDFLRHLQESGVGFDVTAYPVKVQGEELRPTMLAGLRWFAERAAQFDVLCIVRGGGSRTDLAWFDDLEVALAVAQHPLKTLVGIGHQRDQSVLDLIAHSEKTPTAVAEYLVGMAEAAREDLHDQARRLRDAAADLLAAHRRDLLDAVHRLRHGSRQRLRDESARLAQAVRDVQSGARLRLAEARSELRATTVRIANGAARRVERASHHLEQQTTRQRLLDPTRVLQRGFALVRGADGTVLPTAARLQRGADITIQFRDGRARATVDDVTEETS